MKSINDIKKYIVDSLKNEFGKNIKITYGYSKSKSRYINLHLQQTTLIVRISNHYRKWCETHDLNEQYDFNFIIENNYRDLDFWAEKWSSSIIEKIHSQNYTFETKEKNIWSLTLTFWDEDNKILEKTNTYKTKKERNAAQFLYSDVKYPFNKKLLHENNYRTYTSKKELFNQF